MCFMFRTTECCCTHAGTVTIASLQTPAVSMLTKLCTRYRSSHTLEAFESIGQVVPVTLFSGLEKHTFMESTAYHSCPEI